MIRYFTINNTILPSLRKNVYCNVSLNNYFLDNVRLHKIYKIDKDIKQYHLIGNIGTLGIISSNNSIIEGYFLSVKNEYRFYCLENQKLFKNLFPEINKDSFTFENTNCSLIIKFV